MRGPKMKRFDVGITSGTTWSPAGAAGAPRRVDLVGVTARDEKHAIEQAENEWRNRYGDEPPSALIGISRAY
jgi:hypothetical protein